MKNLCLAILKDGSIFCLKGFLFRKENNLLEFGTFQSNPITVTGGELLRSAVGQLKDPPDYQELMRPRITESTAL